MASHLQIDDQLLAEAHRLGKLKTKRKTVNEALREYIQRRKQKEILEVFGKIDFHSDYDYRQDRRRRPTNRIAIWMCDTKAISMFGTFGAKSYAT